MADTMATEGEEDDKLKAEEKHKKALKNTATPTDTPQPEPNVAGRAPVAPASRKRIAEKTRQGTSEARVESDGIQVRAPSGGNASDASKPVGVDAGHPTTADDKRFKWTWFSFYPRKRGRDVPGQALALRRSYLDPHHGMGETDYKEFEQYAAQISPQDPQLPMYARVNNGYLAHHLGALVPMMPSSRDSAMRNLAKTRWGITEVDDRIFFKRVKAEYELDNHLVTSGNHAGKQGWRPFRSFFRWISGVRDNHEGWNEGDVPHYQSRFLGAAQAGRTLVDTIGAPIRGMLSAVNVGNLFGQPPKLEMLEGGYIGVRGNGIRPQMVAQFENNALTMQDVKLTPDVVRAANGKLVYLPHDPLVQAKGKLEEMDSIFRSMRDDQNPGMLTVKSLAEEGEKLKQLEGELRMKRTEHETRYPSLAKYKLQALDKLIAEQELKRQHFLKNYEGEELEKILGKLGDESQAKILEWMKVREWVIDGAKKAFIDGTLSAQGFNKVGETFGMPNLVEDYLEQKARQEREDKVVEGGIPLVIGKENFWGEHEGAIPAVDPYKRKEDREQILKAKDTKSAFIVRLKDGTELPLDVHNFRSSDLEKLLTETTAYLQRHSGSGGAAAAAAAASVVRTANGPAAASGSASKGAGGLPANQVPLVLRQLELQDRVGEIESVTLQTADRALKPIHDRMMKEAAAAEVQLNEYLKQQHLSPEDQARLKLRIISEGARRIPIGLGENLSSDAYLASKLPYVGGGLQIAHTWHVATIAERLRQGEEVSQEELADLNEFLIQSSRDESWAATVVGGALDIASLGIEVGTSAGLVSLGKKVGTEVLEKMVAKGMGYLTDKAERKVLLEVVARRLLKTTAVVGVRTLGPSAHRVAHETFLEMNMPGVGVYQGANGMYHAQLDAGRFPGSLWDTLPKVLLRHGAQNATEHMGGPLLKALSKVPGVKQVFDGMSAAAQEQLLKRALLKTAIEKMGAEKAIKFLSARNEKMGMHNTVEEFVEIYLGAAADKVITGEGHAPTFEELLQTMGSMLLARGMMIQSGGRWEPPITEEGVVPWVRGVPRDGVMRARVWNEGFHAGLPSGNRGATGVAGSSPSADTGASGITNALNGAGGDGTGAQQSGVAGQVGMAGQPQVNEEGEGAGANSEALVPEMAGGPKTDEESGHAVPPGVGGGDTGMKGGPGGITPDGGVAPSAQSDRETSETDEKTEGKNKEGTSQTNGSGWRVRDRNGMTLEIPETDAANYREAAELFIKRFPKSTIDFRTLTPPTASTKSDAITVEEQEFMQAETDGQLSATERFSQVGDLVRANYENWRLVERLQHAAENYDPNDLLSFSTSAHLLVLEEAQARNVRSRQYPRSTDDSPRPIQTAPIPAQTSMEPNTSGNPLAVLSPKHGPGGFGTRTWITEPQAQTMLNTAERHKNQFFAFDDHTGRVYVYQESGHDFDIWHPYPAISDIPGDPSSEVPIEFLRGLKNSGRISNAEYRKMTRGERIRD